MERKDRVVLVRTVNGSPRAIEVDRQYLAWKTKTRSKTARINGKPTATFDVFAVRETLTRELKTRGIIADTKTPQGLSVVNYKHDPTP